MKAFKRVDKDKLRQTMWKIYVIQKEYKQDYCYKNPCSECDLFNFNNCMLSPFVFWILDLNF